MLPGRCATLLQAYSRLAALLTELRLYDAAARALEAALQAPNLPPADKWVGGPWSKGLQAGMHRKLLAQVHSVAWEQLARASRS